MEVEEPKFVTPYNDYCAMAGKHEELGAKVKSQAADLEKWRALFHKLDSKIQLPGTDTHPPTYAKHVDTQLM